MEPRSSGSLPVFIGWAVLALIISQGIGKFLGSTLWKDYPNPVGAIAGVVIMLWGTSRILRREGGNLTALGLDVSHRHLPAFGLSFIYGGSAVVLTFAAITLVQRPQWHAGTASWGHAWGALHAYFWAAMLEELMCRGYLLRRLIGRWGRPWALLAVALPFALLHLPGLSGVALPKMLATTAACSVFFSAAYLRSKTLWSAVGAHLAMNWVLHTVLGGTGRPSLLRADFSTSTPVSVDVGFWAFLLFVGGGAWLLLPRSGDDSSYNWQTETGVAEAKTN